MSLAAAAAGANLGGIGLAPDRFVTVRQHWHCRAAAISFHHEPHQLYGIHVRRKMVVDSFCTHNGRVVSTTVLHGFV